MQPELESRRRVLILTFRRYEEADHDWAVAARTARTWFPVSDAPPRRTIGDPGSRLRRLYERRERALQQLQIIREELDEARHGTRRETGAPRITIRLLTHV